MQKTCKYTYVNSRQEVSVLKRKGIFIMSGVEELKEIVLHQLSGWWKDYNENIISEFVPQAYSKICNCLQATAAKPAFSPFNTVQYSVFLYYLSNLLAKNGGTDKKVPKEAEMVYYLNKIMHANDWFYMVELPKYFLAEHPIGSAMGRARYGDHLFIYQGVTVGANRKDGILYHPTLGDNVLMYANSTILGDSHIGNNVIVSADSYLINETIPDNCIVFGRSPDITIKPASEDKIKDMTSHIWEW